jgi:hypothetical protein
MAHMKLDKYRQSNKLVKAIQEKLDEDQTGYLKAKLGSLDQTYANYLSTQLDGQKMSATDFIQNKYNNNRKKLEGMP